MLVSSSAGDFDDVTLDSYHRQLARAIVKLGVADQVVIRLGAQPNAAWTPWSGDPEGYKRMWRRLVPMYREVSSDLLFDWAPDAGVVPDPAQWYPGNDVVDIVGMTQFDIAGAALAGDPAARWAKIQPSLQWHAGFAHTHIKPAALDDWSLWSDEDTYQGGGGDNPTFVRNIAAWAKDHNYAYTVYDDVAFDGHGTTLRASPAALAAFRTAFAPGPAVDPTPTIPRVPITVPTTTPTPSPTPSPSPSATPTPTPSPSPTGTLKLGVYVAPTSSGGIQGMTQFGNDVGEPVTYAMVYMDARASWDSFANPAWQLDPMADWLRADSSRRMVLSIPMLQTYAAGDFRNSSYDQYFVRLAQSVKDRGIASQVIMRLGYEMNGDWMPWGRQFAGNGDGSGFREMWRRIVPKMKAVYNYPFDWCIVPDIPATAGGGYSPNFYPGDDVVDIIGIDLYDAYVSGSPEQRWQELQAKLDWTAGFAASHGKRMAFDEWALWSSGNSSGGGDNPRYIAGMLDWATNHNLLWTSYFNSREGNVETTLQSNPQGLAAFRSYLADH